MKPIHILLQEFPSCEKSQRAERTKVIRESHNHAERVKKDANRVLVKWQHLLTRTVHRELADLTTDQLCT